MRQVTSDERKKLGMKIIMTAEVYGKEIDQTQLQSLLSIYLGPMFSDFRIEQICSAFDQYTMNTKNAFAPYPAKIREILMPAELTEREMAVVIANDLARMVKKHGDNWVAGYANQGGLWFIGQQTYTTWEESAQIQIGDLGVAIVKRLGWKNIYDSFYDKDEGMFIAQMRDQVEPLIKMAKAGDIDRKFELPQSPMSAQLGQTQRGLEGMGDIMARLVPGGQIKTNDHAVTSDETTK